MTNPHREAPEGAVAAATHTPGPWDKSGFDIWAKSPFNARVKIASANVFSPMNGIDTEGNARLIAAAPELLQVIKDCLSDRGDWSAKMSALVDRVGH